MIHRNIWVKSPEPTFSTKILAHNTKTTKTFTRNWLDGETELAHHPFRLKSNSILFEEDRSHVWDNLAKLGGKGPINFVIEIFIVTHSTIYELPTALSSEGLRNEAE